MKPLKQSHEENDLNASSDYELFRYYNVFFNSIAILLLVIRIPAFECNPSVNKEARLEQRSEAQKRECD